MEMIPMKVGEVDIIWFQVLNERGGRFGEVPPASPIA